MHRSSGRAHDGLRARQADSQGSSGGQSGLVGWTVRVLSIRRSRPCRLARYTQVDQLGPWALSAAATATQRRGERRGGLVAVVALRKASETELPPDGTEGQGQAGNRTAGSRLDGEGRQCSHAARVCLVRRDACGVRIVGVLHQEIMVPVHEV